MDLFEVESVGCIDIVYLTQNPISKKYIVLKRLNQEYSRSQNHIMDLYNESNNDFELTRKIEIYLKKLQVNNVSELKDKDGYYIKYIRKFRGYFELVNEIDEYLVGYAITKRIDIINLYNFKRFEEKLQEKINLESQKIIDGLNDIYSIDLSI